MYAVTAADYTNQEALQREEILYKPAKIKNKMALLKNYKTKKRKSAKIKFQNTQNEIVLLNTFLLLNKFT